jgi:hypothetical protein
LKYFGRTRANAVKVTDFIAQYTCSKFENLPKPYIARAKAQSILGHE